MNIDRVGVILFVERYEACVAFYRDLIGLRMEFSTADLTSFSFGGAYLMVERGGEALDRGKSVSQYPCILRFNVPDVLAATMALKENGVEVAYQEFPWGIVAKFVDPDGNYCEFKDSLTFDKQVSDALSRQ